MVDYCDHVLVMPSHKDAIEDGSDNDGYNGSGDGSGHGHANAKANGSVGTFLINRGVEVMVILAGVVLQRTGMHLRHNDVHGHNESQISEYFERRWYRHSENYVLTAQ